MATAQMDTLIRQLRRAVLRQNGAGRTDGQLLASFVKQQDEAAFEALVRRHGPMVFGVCRRVVRNHHDAEDTFQATFLVLARKASSLKQPERLANWLHGVALRTAMKAKTMTAKRRGREKQVKEMPESATAQQDQWRDLQPLLDQELNGLPENYRLPILLCDLEGKTIKDATQQLGWPQGSLAGRLARGRKLLAKRLASRGVVLSAGSLAAVVSQNVASAGVPTSLMSSTVKAGTMIAAGQATVAGVVPAKVAALMEGVLKSMMLTKLSKAAVAGLVVLCLCGLGVGGFQASSAQETKTTITTTTTVTTKAKKHGIEELQGKWTSRGDNLTIEGNNWSWISPFYGNFSGSLKLVATEGDVLSVDLIVSEGRTKGQTCKAIFRRAGNVLHYCQSQPKGGGYGPRPTDFNSGGIAISWQQIAPRTTAKRVKATVAAEEQEATDKSTTAKECLKQLQGTWQVMTTTGVWAGTPLKTVTISGHNLTEFYEDGSKNCNTFEFVNLTSNPKSLDVTGIPSERGKTAYVIFQIDGDTLYYAMHGNPKARPTDFVCRPGDGRGGWVAQRVNP